MSKTRECTLFVQQVMARLKGDDTAALAAKIARKAVSAVDSQIAALNASQVDAEDAVEEATEALNVAKYPIEEIKDGKNYIRGIQMAEDKLAQATQALEDLNKSIKYFEDLAASF